MIYIKTFILIFALLCGSRTVYADAYHIPDNISIFNVKYTIKLDDKKWEGTIPFNMHVTPYIIINRDRTIYGFAGCNKFVADISINTKTHKFKVSNLANTNRICSTEGLRILEEKFFKSLKDVTSYDILVTQLTLKDKNNYPILAFSGTKLKNK